MFVTNKNAHNTFVPLQHVCEYDLHINVNTVTLNLAFKSQVVSGDTFVTNVLKRSLVPIE